MPQVFKLNSQNEAILHPDAVKLCPEFRRLSKAETLYIVLAYDYHSPFWQYEKEERKRLAMNRAFKSLAKNPESKKIVQAAIESYNSLQYDPLRETLATYKKKLAEMNARMADTEDYVSIRSTAQAIDLLKKSIKEMEQEVEDNEQMEEIKGGGELSFIEIFQKNRTQYMQDLKEITAAKEIVEGSETVTE